MLYQIVGPVWSQDGNNILLNYSPVPEPASYGLIISLLALGLAAARRREHR